MVEMNILSKKILIKLNEKTVFTIIVLAVVIVTCVCTISFSIFKYIDSHLQSAEQPDQIHAVDISYETEFPFESEVKKTAISSPDPSLAESNVSFIDSITDSINTYSTKFKDTIIEFSSEENIAAHPYYYLYGVVNRLLDRNVIENSESNVYRLEDGKLVYAKQCQSAKGAYSYFSDFADWLEERNTEFLYVLPVSIDDDSVIDFPPRLKTGYTEASKELLEFLGEHDIKYLDAKPMLLSKNADFYNWVYKTDHHWNVEAGITVADKIVEIMSNDFGFNVDKSVCDIVNYKSVTYEDALLGSLGRKVTLGYTDAEDLEILYPTFETDFHIEIPELSLDKTGTFDETLIDLKYLDLPYYLIDNAYGAFLYQDRAMIRITNQKCKNGVHALVIKQSKANVVNPYLACAVEQLDMIDPRYFKGSIRSFVEQTNPDLVIICSYGPSSDSDTNWQLK